MDGTRRVEKCPKCDGPVPEVERYCPTCTQDLGPPNVRESGSAQEVASLAQRASEELENAGKQGSAQSIQDFSDSVKTRSSVVVAMPASVARRLVSDPKSVFDNYELLTGTGKRLAATADNDRHRAAVSGLLFGTYGAKIRYGVLSLTTTGLPTYDDVACRLRSIAVQDRVSFLESNSYKFVEANSLKPGMAIPSGYRAVWNNRHLLAVAKLARLVTSTGTDQDWQNLLIYSGVSDRANDEFIEAHIYDGFTFNAIEEMAALPGRDRRREVSLDIKIALEKFETLKKLRT